MISQELHNGAYRVVRDDGLVIAETAGKNQRDPVVNGNLIAWASYLDPQYVICTRTLDGNVLGPIVQQSQNTTEHAIRPFIANGWLFWTQCRRVFTTYAKNLVTGQIVGPWLIQDACGGEWSWGATAQRAVAANRLHWGKNDATFLVIALMFDFTTGRFMSFSDSNPDVLSLASVKYPNGLKIRHPDFPRSDANGVNWTDATGYVVSTTVEARGGDLAVRFSLNRTPPFVAQATAWQLWERIVHPDGTIENATLVEEVKIQFANGQAITAVPSWL